MKRFAALDIETTGLDPVLDRIIAIHCAEVTFPELNITREWGGCVNPGDVPIKPEAQARHGLSDADVRDAPPFRERAAFIQSRLQDATIIAYNGRKHDVQFLHHELVRAGEVGLAPAIPVIDPLELFREDCPHTLGGALQYYCGQPHPEAHDARADVYAMLKVLGMQLAIRPATEVLRNAQSPRRLDHAGWFLEGPDGIVRFGMGKYRGQAINDHPTYLQWMLRRDFDEAVKSIARRAFSAAA
jgi:DNA polymerase-3 subunit epsilon